MLYDETAARANVRNREGKRVLYLGKGDQLTPSARDMLSRERIAVLPADQAHTETYRLPGGGFVTEKPEHMTHLDAQLLVPKTHPRIAFRGAMDQLEAGLLLCSLAVPRWKQELQEILSLARRLIRCDVLNEPVTLTTLCGLTPEQLRSHSHFPQNHYGLPQFMPEVADGEAVLQLNLCRTLARHAELQAAHAFTDRDGAPLRPDILQSLNRMSSMLYILMLREKAEHQ